MVHWHYGFLQIKKGPETVLALAFLLLYWTSQASLPARSEQLGMGCSSRPSLDHWGLLAASWKEGAQWRAMKQGGRRGGGCIFWSKGVVCSHWQLIPHAGGRLSRQADQKVKAPGGPPFEMGMGPRYQTENISKLPATEQLHIHGWDWQ